ncbi:DUF1566 domain-containing protein [Thiohalocapsa sp. ML1]|jgi:hypothetical protein|uniref:DUF1566 domain-containing protein n=1 Tax=Thiohalocapsa sp. ML1 TaxID=1431688 RepID=UPI000731FC0C|nr:DUF1566 domain-containing protein [Thiohalocapsa sp. ML1]
MNPNVKQTAIGLGAGLLLLAGSAQAALVSYQANGIDLVYDDVQDLTWVRDANLFKTQYDADNTVVTQIMTAVPTITSGNGAHNVVAGDFDTTNGPMTWYGAMAWVQWLGSIEYAGADDWRLPAIIDTGAAGCDFAFVGTDCGYNVDTSTGELASLWYDTLGNIAYYDTSGSGPQSGWGLSNTGPFGTSMQDSVYWSGTEYAPSPGKAWLFNSILGLQDLDFKVSQYYGWAVRPGQVAAAPLPGTALLMALGFGALSLSRRARRRLW